VQRRGGWQLKNTALILLASFLFTTMAHARQFLSGDLEIEIYYSHFDSETIPVGKGLAKLKRSDDNFACIVKLDTETFNCTARNAVDGLTWITIPKEDLTKILLKGLDRSLPIGVLDRVTELIETKLERPPLVAGLNTIFRWHMRAFEPNVPDVLKFVVKVNNQERD
jgi:hypothetical protein